ncbi:hypothetical protein [Mycobacterium deserti]|uniref:Uncharacterized protein n=1 Tax=Mycobacterium deserti TaxID=2978347 RepID=A0ABT2M910_9MYCO|nr:hypothetical protein [Mycobacterium deserti]MCT7658744.1 hypothetical protein [Mycobacterium deserti]
MGDGVLGELSGFDSAVGGSGRAAAAVVGCLTIAAPVGCSGLLATWNGRLSAPEGASANPDGSTPADPALDGNPAKVAALNKAVGVGSDKAANDVVGGSGATGVGCPTIAAPAAATRLAPVAAAANRLDKRFISFPPEMVIVEAVEQSCVATIP